MSEEKRKQIAPSVVLACQGNKGAYRELYIHYYRSIYFICKSLTGDMAQAMSLTAEVFVKMFSCIDKLEDHTVFQQWFYSLAVNICRKHTEAVQECDFAQLKKLASEAQECAKVKDKFGFEHTMLKIIGQMIINLPTEARIHLFYRYSAGIDTQKIAVLEKITEDEASELGENVCALLDGQAKYLLENGIDVSMFISDMENTISHLAAKEFVPDAVHKQVSGQIGIDVNPFAAKSEKKEQAQKAELKETAETKKKKKGLTKGDIIFFCVVAVIALFVFGGIKLFYEAKNAENSTTTASVQQQASPVLLWNGAAAAAFGSGSGTEDDPYIISSGGQLAYLANLVNEGNSYYSSCHYKLGNDILLNETADFEVWGEDAPENEWTPIGGTKLSDGSYSCFSGTFDGDGRTVYGVYVTDENEYSGFFGLAKNAVIKNICLSDAYVSGKNIAGGIVAEFSADNDSISSVANCSFSGSVKASEFAGGVAGKIISNGNANTVEFSENCAFGTVYSPKGTAGGICGSANAVSGSVKVRNSFSSAAVSASQNAGGICGLVFVQNSDVLTELCYNSGGIAGATNNGAVCGFVSGADGDGVAHFANCFAKEGTADKTIVMGLDGRISYETAEFISAEDMSVWSSYENFNFEEIWKMGEENNYFYPVLRGTVIENPIFISEEASA